MLGDLSKKELRKIAKKMMQRAMTIIKKEARKDVSGRILKSKTGNLKKGFKSFIFKDFNAIIKNIMPHAHLLENGAVLRPKNKEYMTYQIDGRWVKIKESILPKRIFLKTHLDGFPNSLVYGEMEKVMQKEFNKLKEKYR